MSAGSLSRRYAKALMELGLEDNSYSKMGTEVASISKSIESSEQLRDILSSPMFPRSERETIMLSILGKIGVSKNIENFIKLLLDRERMGILGDISREFSAMIEEKSGQLRAEVVSAKPLSAAQTSELKKTLEALSGKTIEISAKEDPALLGGLIAKVGDLVYDGSLRTQLQELKRTLGR